MICYLTEWTFHGRIQFDYRYNVSSSIPEDVKDCRGVIIFISNISTCYPFTIAIC